jgi:4-amino-4-deoxy-L-arabinose transferase-like glycosyltransferase
LKHFLSLIGMPISEQKIASSENDLGRWLQNGAAAVVVLLGGFARLWTAWGTFLNPDEALHFRLANQLSLTQAYRASLTASHPPLLTIILYFWRAMGTSELWLRMPSVLAGVAFCCMFYKWLVNATGALTGFIGLLLVAFLPPIVELGAEIRQYSLLLAFLAGAVFLLDEAFTKNSTGRMWAFSFCLYFAMLSHYSAFLFAAALGFYALLRILRESPPVRLVTAWGIGQAGGFALAVFLYKTHISKLGAGESRTALEGWMSEFFLRRSYFDAVHDHYLTFLLGHTFGVFQYFFGQLALGDVMGIFFAAGIVLLLAKESPENRRSSQSLGVLLLLMFALACGASVAHAYPYGGTRHMAFLIIPAIAGVSVTLARLAKNKWPRGVVVTFLIVIVCVAFGKPRPPRMDRSDQSRERMAAAMSFIQQNVGPADLIFTDYQTDLILGHYLCQQHPISFQAAQPGFEQFSCAGHRIVSRDYKGWIFWADNFPQEWQRFLQAYKPGQRETVWVVQAGWGVGLPEDLRAHYAQFHDLQFESFGKNVKIFKQTVGQSMPLSSARVE